MQNWGGRTIRSREPESLVEIASPRNHRKAIFMVLQQYSCLNKTQIMITTVGVLAYKGKISQGSTIDKGLQAIDDF